jgi:RimJ/RimL family protein N-acetyltransferase
MALEVSIRPYAESDLWILERTLGDPEQMVHLNGPETMEKVRERHRRYVAMSADKRAGCMYTIMTGLEGAAAGNVGYWEAEWEGEKAWETGWFVLPEFQRKGIATGATRMLVNLVAKLGRQYLLAYPSVDNLPSNAICREVGFVLTGQVESEYPPKSGRSLRVNVWRLDLSAV